MNLANLASTSAILPLLLVLFFIFPIYWCVKWQKCPSGLSYIALRHFACSPTAASICFLHIFSTCTTQSFFSPCSIYLQPSQSWPPSSMTATVACGCQQGSRAGCCPIGQNRRLPIIQIFRVLVTYDNLVLNLFHSSLEAKFQLAPVYTCTKNL